MRGSGGGGPPRRFRALRSDEEGDLIGPTAARSRRRYWLKTDALCW